MLQLLLPVKKSKVWGGRRLADEFSKGRPGETIGETWELSCRADGMSRLEDGRTLLEYLKAEPEAAGLLAADYQDFPLLIKLIDAADDLSVQVHPPEDFALAHERDHGKDELWYVLEAEPGALLYCGFREDLTEERFSRLIREERLPEVLNAVRVQGGEHFYIPAGTVHAIGAGCLVAEIQQSSDLTYRLYDYGRKDAAGRSRELHIEKAKAVTSLQAYRPAEPKPPFLIKAENFSVQLLEVQDRLSLMLDETSFRCLLTLDEGLRLECDGMSAKPKKGQTVFVSAGRRPLEIEGRGRFLMAYLS